MQPTVPILTDGVVTLRAPEPGDVDAITAGCQEPDVSRFTAIPSPYRREHAEAFVHDAAKHWADRSSANFVVVDAESDELLGGCGSCASPTATGCARWATGSRATRWAAA